VLADAAKGCYWIAEQAGKIIGRIMVTYEWSDWRNDAIWWIQSVYVDSNHRRQGVFSTLYRHVESLAREDKSVCGLRLYVERENRNAQATYAALGMSDAGYEVMQTDFSKSINVKE
jgi:GNAT superfamily N-acetyltransferase